MRGQVGAEATANTVQGTRGFASADKRAMQRRCPMVCVPKPASLLPHLGPQVSGNQYPPWASKRSTEQKKISFVRNSWRAWDAVPQYIFVKRDISWLPHKHVLQNARSVLR